jgi:calcineurin-like phosphoesterase family protein
LGDCGYLIHFHHKNIVKGTSEWKDKSICREFETLEHHDEYLIHIINQKIKWDHTLLFLGDWSFGGFEYIKRFRDRINCREIHFVLGNHDHHIESNREDIQSIFNSVQDKLHIEIKDKNFILDHMPLETWHNIFKGWFHLFGHQHSNRIGPGRKMDVGIDKEGTLISPYSIDEIVSILESIEIEGGIGDSNIEVETKTKFK